MHCLLLVTFGIVARVSRDTHRFRDLRMDEIPMTALSATIRKPRSFEIPDQLSHFRGMLQGYRQALAASTIELSNAGVAQPVRMANGRGPPAPVI